MERERTATVMQSEWTGPGYRRMAKKGWDGIDRDGER